MQNLKGKTLAILIAAILTISIGASTALMPSASAHTPPWQIPTYAYIMASPNPIGIGQTLVVYMWLDPVYGAAGGNTAIVGTNGYTCSAALTSNDYRFENYKLTITAPNGAVTTQTFAVISDPTSNVYTYFTPTAVGTYNLTFAFPGQVYGANGDGYSGSNLINDTYLPSSASTTLVVQQTQIPAATTSEPLPTNYWNTPIYGENSNWYAISSNWLGTGSPSLAGFTTSANYPGDAIGPMTSHIMWTQPVEMGGIVGGAPFPNDVGVGYFEGSAYQQRFVNPIVIDGYLIYTETVSFTGPSSGPTVCVNLQTGQQLWSSTTVPPLSFGYVYDVWNGEQHGVFPPILFTANFAQAFDAYTGEALFNVTGVPAGTSVMGPSGELLRYVFVNAGTAAKTNWYLAQWNSSKMWQYDVNPYTFTGSLSPSIVNASNGALISTIPIPISGETGTLPSGASIAVPYGSTLTVNANIPITPTTVYPLNIGAQTTYDWNVSVPWLNTMPLVTQATLSAAGEAITQPTPGSNPVTIVAANPGDVMLCRNATLPGGFMRVYSGFPQLPYTLFTVNLNATVGPIGEILWMQNYNPPAGNLTLTISSVDWQTRVFVINYGETMQWVGYSLTNGAQLWGPTASQASFDYYTTSYGSTMAYGNLYSMGYAGICYCYNDLTGKLLWTYGNGPMGSDNSTNSGFETSYGDYPSAVSCIGNGVVYIVSEEHTSTDPVYKGALIRAINATTGQQIWTLSDYS